MDSRILIIKLGAIGDVVSTLPLLARLRASDKELYIAWAVEPRAHSLLRGHPMLDEVLLFDRDRGATGFMTFQRRVRAGKFDLVLDLQRILKSGLISYLSGAKRRIGFDRARAKEFSYLFATEHLPKRPRNRRMVDQYLEFADLLRLRATERAFPLPPAFAKDASEPNRDIVIAIGAGKPANRYPAVKFGDLVTALSHHGLAVTLLGKGLRERCLSEEIIRIVKTPIENLVDRMTLPETARVIQSSRLFIGLDSGLTHLASALAHPSVVLFGAADPKRTGPCGNDAEIVRSDLPCSPCGRRHCPLATTACMEGISAEEIASSAASRLSRRDLPLDLGGSRTPTTSHT